MENNIVNEIIRIHKDIKDRIRARLNEFKNVPEKSSNDELFGELAFCLFTPQSGARICWRAVCNLTEKDLLLNGCYDDIRAELNIVRFRNNKARYLIEARERFIEGDHTLKDFLFEPSSVFEKRERLVKEVKGLGFKEASHFLRNVGFGNDIAILDRHILRNMVSLGLITDIPKSLSLKVYLDFEKRLESISKKIDIPLSHIDFVLWYKETGDLFK